MIFNKIYKSIQHKRLQKYQEIPYNIETKNGVMISSQKDYRNNLKLLTGYNLDFNACLKHHKTPSKKYIDLNFAVHFQCYDNFRATDKALSSLRKFYPAVPVHLISDAGKEFTAIANDHECTYTHTDINLGYHPCKDILAWFERLYETCLMFNKADWILLMEDDVRIRDKISKYPNAHLAGQGGGRCEACYSKAIQKYLRKLNPGLEINGYSGCGGSIFHRKSFMHCYENKHLYDIKQLKQMDQRLGWATDIALTCLFNLNGYVCRRWLDFSEESIGLHGPASAVDHQFKEYY